MKIKEKKWRTWDCGSATFGRKRKRRNRVCETGAIGPVKTFSLSFSLCFSLFSLSLSLSLSVSICLSLSRLIIIHRNRKSCTMIDLINKALLNLFHALACCWVSVSLFLCRGSGLITLNHIPSTLLRSASRYCARAYFRLSLNPFGRPSDNVFFFSIGFCRFVSFVWAGWKMRYIEKIHHDRFRARAESRSKIRISDHFRNRIAIIAFGN